ncbi:type VI secretion system membrane subunit TssM [Mesorhizobium sp. YR577]|uniref:type VI secretion system membrane subunit TssM n=1 Tax=Mesorhizobium sp. YR577 TaxID=1884373 RepID=UPI0008DFDA22|nr:type VI secretion system membrane subunit TssM [Mesorhizobium sp. YR577]SFT72110.1 type VI secretion system protein ImpL [Mesorhizobium sp. YR577]
MDRKQPIFAWLGALLALLGLVCFGLVVWFAGPLITFNGSQPLDSVWIRTGVIAAATVLVAGAYAVRALRARGAQKAIEAALLSNDDQGSDGPLLAKRMADAIEVLKRASGKSSFLYEMPWYVVIGPPGAGKTTALVNSGLKFPLAEKEGAAPVEGVGGTRNCDFWFTDDAVLIDTAGRYTTHESDAETDKKSWLSFLSLLKANRTKQPINGVIVAISVEDLLTLPEWELASHANAIRKRLFELLQELKVDFPVYALFTKADLIEGFREYFGSFTEARRRKVWGATFQTEKRKQNLVSQVPVEFDALVSRLTEELPDRLQEEPDATARIAIFGFPAQVGALRDRVADFLNQIFDPARPESSASLRGFYFSSGTQEGTPIDQLIGAMGRNLAVRQASENLSGRGKSFFIHDLLQDLIFAEAGWGSLDKGIARRSAMLRYGGMAAIAGVSALVLGTLGWSFAANKSLITAAGNSIESYSADAGQELTRQDMPASEPVTGADLSAIAALLNQLREMPAGYAHRNEPTPVSETFGLTQRETLSSATEETYRNALERMLRPRLVLRTEQQLAASINQPTVAYPALKTYLMLGGKAPGVEDDFITGWMARDWEANLLPGAGNEAARQELSTDLRDMLELGRSHVPAIELDGKLIAQAQQSLAGMKLADRAGLVMSSSAYAKGLRDLPLLSGEDAAKVFETRDGTQLDQLNIPGLYTNAGFHKFFLMQLASVADRLAAEQWVMGDAGQNAEQVSGLEALGPELVDRYSKDFIEAWEKVLSNLKLKSITQDQPDYGVLAAASSETSPLLKLLETVGNETALSRGDGSLDMDSAQIDGLARIGLIHRKSQLRAGEAAGSAAGAANPGANIEAYFRLYQNWIEGTPGSRPVDILLKNLGEVRESLKVITDYPSQSGPANEKLRLQVVNLRGTMSRLPKPFATMISEVVEEFEGAEASSSKSQLNQALAANITKSCQRIVSGKYPFARDADGDVQIGEFTQLFGPNGLMDKFFDEHLAPLANITGDAWDWQKDTRLGRELSSDTLRQFQRAAEIRNAFFADGSPTPAVKVTIAPHTISKDAEALLVVNQIVIQTSMAGNTPQTIAWPGDDASSSAKLSIFPEIAGRDSSIDKNGPWALMRLIDTGSIAQEGDDLVVRFVVGGREVSYSIRTGSSYNPLFLPALRDFNCPAGF